MSIVDIATAAPRDTLWKNGAFAEDRFAVIDDNGTIEGGSIISLARWRKERASLIGLNTPLGLIIQPGENWDDVVSDLSRFAVIAVAIPKYADGRAFSIGRLLRQRDGFQGELRAIGAFVIDQVPMLQRVGFDAVAVNDPILRRQLVQGDWPEVPTYLQPMDNTAEVPAGTRPWTRRSVARNQP